MKIKNSEVEELATFLLDFKLKGKENRMRNKFFKILQKHLADIQEEHKDLLNEYCKVDSEGKFITFTKDNKQFYDVEDVQGFQKEFEELMNEFLYIPLDESNHEMFSVVKDIIVNCEKEFSGKEALHFEAFCELFENELLSISN